MNYRKLSFYRRTYLWVLYPFLLDHFLTLMASLDSFLFSLIQNNRCSICFCYIFIVSTEIHVSRKPLACCFDYTPSHIMYPPHDSHLVLHGLCYEASASPATQLITWSHHWCLSSWVWHCYAHCLSKKVVRRELISRLNETKIFF